MATDFGYWNTRTEMDLVTSADPQRHHRHFVEVVTGNSNALYRIDPLEDPRWKTFVECYRGASVFHTSGWLEALRLTYGYEPVAFTHSAPGTQLKDGIVLCRVKSWLTGCRMVSLPFSDHCQPLVEGGEPLQSFLSSLRRALELEKLKYIEIRPLFWPCPATESDLARLGGDRFLFHKLSLEPDLPSLFRGFHKSCIQRRIRRAEREGLTYEEGRSESLLDRFYRLLVATRGRHRLPPQPFRWFQNLTNCLGDGLTIRMLSKDRQPVASILTLAYRETLVYKYGCSDERFHKLGAMPLLFWETIQRAKAVGLRELDLGRSDWKNEGLVRFKNHLGATSSSIAYYRYPAQAPAPGAVRRWASSTTRSALAHLPNWSLVRLGNLLYKHLG